MLRLFGAIILLLISHSGTCQQKTTATPEQASLDSLFRDDEFLNMLKDALVPKSYFLVNLGAGNSYFSTRNKQVNASQLESKLVLTPSAGYYHKSGLSLSASAYLADFTGTPGFYQFGISPAYSLAGNKKIAINLGYTHIFTRNGFERFASPIRNEIYGNAYLKKTWLQPGIALGFSGGRYREIHHVDTVLNGVRRVFLDTVNSTIRIFSLNAFVQHSFDFFGIFSKRDGISITPQLLVNTGKQKYTETHQNPFITRLRSTGLMRFKNLGTISDKSSYTVQSVALNLDLAYIIGKLSIQPQVYLDYYLPETDDNRFTAVYSLVLGFAF